MATKTKTNLQKFKAMIPPLAEKKSSPFSGNGLSRTAMIYKIATLAGHKLRYRN